MKSMHFEISKKTDKQIISAIKQIFCDFGEVPIKIRVHLFIGDGDLDCPYNEIENNDELLTILSYDSELIESFFVDFRNPNQITIHRNNDKPFDRVSLNPNMLDQNTYLRLIALVKKELNAFDTQRAIARTLDDNTKTHYEIRESELNRLQQIAEQVTKNTDEYRRLLDERYLQKIKDDEELFSQKQNALEESFKQKEEELTKLRLSIEEKLKTIDDRGNTHVRRQIREQLKSELQKRQSVFELTHGTQKLRSPIYYFLLVLLLGFGGMLILFSFETYHALLGTNPLPINLLFPLIARQILIAISFGATSIYYLRWTNQWFQRHAEEEFRTKRFDIDIDRASWVVEMALEWKNEKGTDIPVELLNKLMHNMFNEPTPQTELIHPAEQLASTILGASSSINLKTGEGSEIIFDRKGIKKILKTKDH